MSTVILNTRVETREKEEFEKKTAALGTTPANAIKMFVRAFNERGGFPFDTSTPYANQRLSAEAEQSYQELLKELSSGTAKTYKSHQELRAELRL
jgi:DNA-damage-inducible protein J